LIGPGRSLRFSLLPEGEDPDDLVQRGGGEAVSRLLTRVLPLSDLIWVRETEGKIFATPERRAGLERRLNEIARKIRDEALRRHYQADFKARLFQLFGRGGHRPFPGQRNPAGMGGPKSLWQSSSGQGSDLAAAPAVSQSLVKSPLLCPGKSRLPPREGLILLLILNHPGLIARYLEELAEAELSSSEAGALRDALIAVSQAPPQDAALGPSLGVPGLRASLEKQGFGPVLQKLDLMAAHGSHWYVKENAAEADAEEVLKQALNLHRRAKALHKELQLAELALGKDSSEANLSRLKDIQAQLSALGGVEAAREGFGVQSGRPSGTL